VLALVAHTLTATPDGRPDYGPRRAVEMRSIRRLLATLVFAALTSALAAALIVPTAFGWAGTVDCTTALFVCVSLNDNNTTPRAVTSTNDSTYVNDYYINNPATINNTVSSVKNRDLDEHVTFHHNVGNSGTGFCLEPDWYNADLGNAGFGNDDHFSSHEISYGPC
jgi:opacity protein-like surface antigen